MDNTASYYSQVLYIKQAWPIFSLSEGVRYATFNPLHLSKPGDDHFLMSSQEETCLSKMPYFQAKAEDLHLKLRIRKENPKNSLTGRKSCIFAPSMPRGIFRYHNFATYAVLKGSPLSGPSNLFLSRAQFGHNRSTSPTSRLNLDPTMIAHSIQDIKKQDLRPAFQYFITIAPYT
jgi:hypothetical protein